MKTATLLFAPLLLASGVISQNVQYNGNIFENYCCSNGAFSGPVYSSFQQSFSNRGSSMSASFSSRDASRSASQASLQASLSSKFSTMTGATDAMITARAELIGRAITTEVTPGLTCIGDAVSTLPGDGSGGIIIGSGTICSSSGSSAASSAASSAGSSASAVSAGSSSSSHNFAPMVTQAPMLVAGAAAAFAYGAL